MIALYLIDPLNLNEPPKSERKVLEDFVLFMVNGSEQIIQQTLPNASLMVI